MILSSSAAIPQPRDIIISARFGQHQRWLTTLRFQKYLADSTYHIIVFILCFYVVPSSTTTAPPTEQTTKTTSSKKITSTGNEKPEGKLGTSTAQRRKGNQKTELKNTSVKILFSLALLSGLFTAPLLKNPLALFLFFLAKGNGLQYGRILCFD